MRIRILGRSLIAIFICITAVGAYTPTEVFASEQTSKNAQAKKKKSTAGKSNSKKSSGKNGTANKASGKSSGKASGKRNSSKTGTSTKKNVPETSAELKKRQESVREEVQRTREEIRRNDASIKKGLSELSRLEEGINSSKKETAALGAELGKLNSKIETLNKSIAENGKELERLRSEYLKAVKKMRVSQKKNSPMAYIFSAGSLAQAERRMRYLKEFSEWKNSRTKDIESKVALLKKENEQLARAKSDKDVMLAREMKAQTKLTEQKQRQDALVAELRANGDALQQHLANKQSEANELRNRVAAVIAEEQRKAEAKRREEERKRAEEERLAEERRKAEEERARKEEIAQNNPDKPASQKEVKKNEVPKKEVDKKDVAKKDVAKKDTPKKGSGSKNDKKVKERSGLNGNSNNRDYASARKRKPRNSSSGAAGGGVAASGKSSGGANAQVAGNFASMKGSLPKPVAGSFRITSPFGKHTLPDLPDITYDNPGIDAEVPSGAAAQAVYQGRVSGVYMVPGFATVVIVNHGDYYTVYGNIASASVKVGDNVKQGQSVGTIAADPDSPGHSTIHFEVWKGREKLNPSQWIK